ncbi:MAG: VOC family protein [Candidatus Binatia bacterium]|nr:VOC family protein [Candidatus Binatia bacterium]
MSDVGLTHIALPVTQIDTSIAFYAKYAHMQVVHRRTDAQTGAEVVWLSDRTRPFVLVLIEVPQVAHPLLPSAHLGVGCATRAEVDHLCEEARREGRLRYGPLDSGYPVGYWALIADPDGHTLELSFGQEVALTVARSS